MKAIKNKPDSKLVRNIQVFLGSTKFHRRFIKLLGKIATSLILKLITMTISLTEIASTIKKVVHRKEKKREVQD